MAVGNHRLTFRNYGLPVAVLAIALIFVWLDDSLIWWGLAAGLTFAHLIGDNTFSRRKSPPAMSLAVVFCDIFLANGIAGAFALVLAFVGVGSRASDYDAAIWGYGTAAIIFSAPLAAAALVVRLALQSKLTPL